MKSIAILAMLILNWSLAKGQSKNVKLNLTGGLAFRTNPFDFQNNISGPSNPSSTYGHSRNVMGFSFCPGLGVGVGRFGLEYFAGLRYDAIHSVQIGNDNKYHKEFIIDHHVNVSYRVKRISYGIGASIVNAGKSIEYYTNINNPPVQESIEFKTINFFVAFPLWKIFNLEAKLITVSNAYPYNRLNDYFMFSTRLFYRFQFLRKTPKDVQ